MKKNILGKGIILLMLAFSLTTFAQAPKFKVIAFYSTNVEPDHIDFAKDAIKFYTKMAAEKGFAFDTTSNWDNLN